MRLSLVLVVWAIRYGSCCNFVTPKGEGPNLAMTHACVYSPFFAVFSHIIYFL